MQCRDASQNNASARRNCKKEVLRGLRFCQIFMSLLDSTAGHVQQCAGLMTELISGNEGGAPNHWHRTLVDKGVQISQTSSRWENEGIS
jgi:hypothetical protein